MARLSRAERKQRSGQWWKANKEDVHAEVIKACDAIREHQAQRNSAILFNHELYGARPEALFGFTHIVPEASESEAIPLPINVVAQVIDGYVSRVAKSRPRVLHVPVGGNYSARRKAKDRTKFVDGVWYETRFRQQARAVGHEAGISGTGMLKVYPYEGKVCHEVVPPEEIWVDELDGRYGTPRTIWQRRPHDRSQLMEKYPEKAFEIDGAGAVEDVELGTPGYDAQADQVLVTEAWHLPSVKGGKDGRHVICLDNCTLVDEPWEHDRFPFAKLQFKPPTRGFWTTGLADEVYGIQEAINDLMEQILVSLRENGKPRILVERGSKVNPADFTDDLGADIIEYTGRPPVVVSQAVVPREVYEMVWQLVSRAFQQVGLSEMTAQAIKPAGLTSGAALRTWSDVQTSRYALDSQEWEDWHLEVAELDLMVASDLAKQGEYSVLWVGRRFGRHIAERIEFWEPKEGEEYVLRAYPTSLLPETPAGKLAMLGELEGRGYIGPEESMDLLDLPDLDRATNLRASPIRVIEDYLENMIDRGKYRPPDPHMPLELVLARTKEAYLEAKVDGVPMDRQALLLQFIDETAQMMEAASGAGEAQEEAPTQGGGNVAITPSTLSQVLSVNEVRQAYGFPPLALPDGAPDPQGNMSVASYSAQNEQSQEVAA